MKVSGSYESVVRGVSQQTPQDRRSGQHKAQVNMISDPVRGLSRRQGSRLLAEAAVVGAGDYTTLLADTKNHRVSTFYIEGVEYDLIHRTTTAPIGAGADAFLWAFNRDTEQFIPVVRSTDDETLDQLVSGGVSAAVGIGRYAYLAGNTISPSYDAIDFHGDDTNKSKAVVWVRGGAYSRTFKIKLTLDDGSEVEASYKTVPASYPELLDTSDILSSDPDYQKKVNDRVYAYNSQVTAWIGIAAEDITPENIADLLKTDLIAEGIAGVSVIGGTVCINDPSVVTCEAEDGGDGSLIRAVDNEVTAPELVSSIHWAGKIVKVKPSKAREDDAFYLKAVPKHPDATGFTQVTWQECAGFVMQPMIVFCMATVYDGTLYLAGSPSKLSALTGIEVPSWKANEVGDGLTAPLPSFFGKRIDYLGSFQDRLVIGCGATIGMSRPGDYLNFFRQSVLSVIDSDPVEMYALGAEDDVIRHGVTFDRDLFLYGRRFQYAISGKQVLTPKTASIVTASAYKDAGDTSPKASGNFVFYAKHTPDQEGVFKTSLHQVAAGQLTEQPESDEVSQQLDDYISGRPAEIVTLTAPNMVVLRTNEKRDGFYTFSYMDINRNTERVMDAWSHWEWSEQVGNLVGVTNFKGGFLAYVLRERNGVIYIAAERFVLQTALSELPYADSLQPLSAAEAAPSMVADGAIVALARDGGPHGFMGQPYDQLDAFTELYPTELARAWVGFTFDAYVTPTNPFMRDRNNKPILGGRYTLGQVRVSVADTAAMLAEVTSSNGTRTALDFNGRVIGSSSFILGEQPIATTTLPFTVGKEIRACEYTLRAKSWLPLTITNIEWTMQVFNNTRRV